MTGYFATNVQSHTIMTTMTAMAAMIPAVNDLNNSFELHHAKFYDFQPSHASTI
jgi:L-serine deaminase